MTKWNNLRLLNRYGQITFQRMCSALKKTLSRLWSNLMAWETSVRQDRYCTLTCQMRKLRDREWMSGPRRAQPISNGSGRGTVGNAKWVNTKACRRDVEKHQKLFKKWPGRIFERGQKGALSVLRFIPPGVLCKHPGVERRGVDTEEDLEGRGRVVQIELANGWGRLKELLF